MAYQLRPARETVLARDCEVCVREGDSSARSAAPGRRYARERSRVSAARITQQVFGLLPELLE
ncbi:MAG: hypothetical protein ACREL7_19730 [Longimicrobiales bacterium]